MASKLRTDIAYVHSTTKNVNLLPELTSAAKEYTAYLAMFNDWYNKLKNEHDRILGYYGNDETALTEDLNKLLINTNDMSDFDRFRNAVSRLANKLATMEKGGKWKCTPNEDGTFTYENSSYRGRKQTLEDDLNVIKEIIEKYKNINTKALKSLAGSVKKSDGKADTRYTNSADTIINFINTDLKPLINNFEKNGAVNASGSFSTEIRFTPEMKAFLEKWNSKPNGTKYSTEISVAYGFLSEPAVIDRINEIKDKKISSILTILNSKVTGQEGGYVDTSISVGMKDQMTAQVVNEELRVQLKTGKWSSSGVLHTQNRTAYKVNQKYGYRSVFTPTLAEEIILCNLYIISFQPVYPSKYNPAYSDGFPLSKSFFVLYLLSLIFKKAFVNIHTISDLPSLVLTPDGYYWYDEYLKSYWGLLLNPGFDPMPIYNYFVKPIEFSDVNEKMYEEKLEIRKSYLSKYKDIKKSSKESGIDPSFQSYYLANGTYGKQLEDELKNISVRHAIWSLSRQKL